ncbi:MAG: thiazole synthase [Blastocatellia bacterium]|nr:thiazole synthase [Blastocatellia bacterium]
MRIEVNGEPRELAGEMVLSELVRDLALAPERVAVELNKKVVRRVDWPTTAIVDGDRIEIVHFVGGGEAGKGQRARREE